ncbi:MAG: MarR family winged helix-turn-helix transcriptional regulator [Planctomycetota bacterium]|jgi:DNA-binding MarR family transcriptional regulator
MSPALTRQAERLYQVFAELVRGYQLRDREGICCHGLSVSQCYTLEALEAHGPATMGELASRMFLELSSMTRIVDRLVADKLASRAADPTDRRVCRVQITRQGRALVSRVRSELIREQELMLREIPAGSREAVISAMSHLLSAFKQRQQRRCEAA